MAGGWVRRRGQSLEALRRTHLHPAPPDQLFSDGLEHLLCGRTPSQCWLGRGGAFSTNGLCCVLGLPEGEEESVALFHGRAAEMVLVCLWGLHPLPPFLSRDIFRASPPTEYVEREYSVEEDRHKGGRPPSPLLPPSISLSFSIFWTLFYWREIKSAALGIPLNATDPPLPLLSFCSLRTQHYTHRNIIASVCFLLFPLAAANDAGRGGQYHSHHDGPEKGRPESQLLRQNASVFA